MSKLKRLREKMRVKYFVLVFTILLVLTATAQAAPEPPVFQDLEGSFARDAVLELTGLGITSGI
jgi:hypothetical protein